MAYPGKVKGDPFSEIISNQKDGLLSKPASPACEKYGSIVRMLFSNRPVMQWEIAQVNSLANQSHQVLFVPVHVQDLDACYNSMNLRMAKWVVFDTSYHY
jgi:hypothetical protein